VALPACQGARTLYTCILVLLHVCPHAANYFQWFFLHDSVSNRGRIILLADHSCYIQSFFLLIILCIFTVWWCVVEAGKTKTATERPHSKVLAYPSSTAVLAEIADTFLFFVSEHGSKRGGKKIIRRTADVEAACWYIHSVVVCSRSRQDKNSHRETAVEGARISQLQRSPYRSACPVLLLRQRARQEEGKKKIIRRTADVEAACWYIHSVVVCSRSRQDKNSHRETAVEGARISQLPRSPYRHSCHVFVLRQRARQPEGEKKNHPSHG
jgi:hypothetical protein